MALVRVLSPRSEPELAVVRSLLEAHDIPVFVHGRHLGSLFPGLQIGNYATQSVMVPEERVPDALELLSAWRDNHDAGISFGDNVRILRTAETERLGIAEMIGNVYGETTPSDSKVEVVGELTSDYAMNVYFESLDASYWLAPQLLQFVDHAPGTEVFVHGSPYKSVHQRDGSWKKVPLVPDRPSFIRRLLEMLTRSR